MKHEESTLTEAVKEYKEFIGIDKRESLINFKPNQKVKINPNNHGFKCLKKYDRAKLRELEVATINEKTGRVRCYDLLSGGTLYYHYQNLLIIE